MRAPILAPRQKGECARDGPPAPAEEVPGRASFGGSRVPGAQNLIRNNAVDSLSNPKGAHARRRVFLTGTTHGQNRPLGRNARLPSKLCHCYRTIDAGMI